jgi:uncharacterized membrane protein
MAALYFIAGINHLLHPQGYMNIMPPYIPFPKELVFLSGLVEIGCALLLLPSFSRKPAAWGIILLLIAVFPANIQMAINFYKENNSYLWLTLLRLPLQVLLLGWAYRFTNNT